MDNWGRERKSNGGGGRKPRENSNLNEKAFLLISRGREGLWRGLREPTKN